MSRRDLPTPKGEASPSATQASGKDATQGEHAPLPVTQDPNATAPGSGPGPTGKLDQDRDGVAETPEVGQEHGAPPSQANKFEAKRLGASADRPVWDCTFSGPAATSATPDGVEAKSFEEVCDEIGKGVKKLTEAGVGGQAAGQLAVELWCRMNGRRSF